MNQTDGQQPTILVAEDDEDNRLVMKMLLELRGYRVLVAANGHEALTLAERESPDLILMDLRMPQLNGLATARHLRQHERTELRRVPIIALSAYDPSQHRNVSATPARRTPSMRATNSCVILRSSRCTRSWIMSSQRHRRCSM